MLLLSKWIKYLIYIFVLSTLVIPTASINKVIFMLIFIIYGFQVLYTGKIKLLTIAPLLIFIIFIYGYFRSSFTNSNNQLAIQFMLFTSILFLIYPILTNKINFNKIVKQSGIIFSICTIYIYIFILKDIQLPIIDSLENIFNRYGLVAMGYRGFFGKDSLFIHFGSVPFLYLPTCIFFKEYLENKDKKNIIIIVTMMFAIHLSSSRALMLGTLLTMFILYFYKSNNKTKILKLFSSLVVIYILFVYIIINSNIFDFNEASNKVKIGDAISFFDSLNIGTLIIGNGLATYFYAAGRNSMAVHTENSLFDTIRYLGIILTSFVYSSFLFPKLNWKFPRRNIEDLIIISIYLLMSMTNPILFNSLGGVLILWYWNNVLSVEVNERVANEKICYNCNI